MEIKILSKEYVLKNGVDFEDLWWEYCSDRVLDNPEEEGEPFTGLTYEMYPNGNLMHYCYYKKGFSDGDFIEFYNDEKIKSARYMQRGRIYGIKRLWRMQLSFN